MAEVIYFRYTHTANVTGTTPGHYYESDVRYGTGRYVREDDYLALQAQRDDLLEALNCIKDGEIYHNKQFPSDIAEYAIRRVEEV